MKKTGKRILSLLLSALMVISMIPTFAVTASAAAVDGFSTNYLTDEASFNSLTGSGGNGTITGDVFWDGTENAAYFNGGYITVDESPFSGVTNSTGFTISFDYKRLNTNENQSRLIDINDGTTTNTFAINAGSDSDNNWRRLLTLAKVNDSECNYYANDLGDETLCSPYHSSSICGEDPNGWHNLTVSMDALGYYSYYFDGVLRGTFVNNYEDSSISGDRANGVTANAIKTQMASMNKIMIGKSVYTPPMSIYDDPTFKGYIKNIKLVENGEVGSLVASTANYERKMDGTLFKSMAPAYNAYVAANKAYDAYLYGGASTSNFATLANTLNTATDAMTAWEGKPTANAVQSYSVNELSNDIDRAASNSVNIISSNRNSTTGHSEATNNTVENVSVKLYYAENVLLYDGVTQPRFPVTFSTRRYNNKGKYTHTVYPAKSAGEKARTDNASEDFDLFNDKYSDHSSCWIGRDGRINYTYTMNQGEKVGGNATNTDSHYTGKLNNDERYFVNAARYIGTPNAAMLDFQIMWSQRTSGNQDIGPSNITSDDFGTATSSIHTYVYNYAGIKNLFDTKVSAISNITNYKQGGLATILGYCDRISVGWSNMLNNISDANSAYSSLSSAAAPTADNSDYNTLRSYLADGLGTKTIGTLGTFTIHQVISDSSLNADTVSNYASFENAYNAARSHMANLPTTGYTGVGTLATTLQSTFNALDEMGAADPSITADCYLGPNNTISVTNNDDDTVDVKYTIAYDGGATGATQTVSGVAGSSAASINVFNGSTTHSTATVTAWVTKNGKNSNSVSANYTLLVAPTFSVEDNAVISKDGAVTITNGNAVGTVQYSLNGSDYSEGTNVYPFNDNTASVKTIYAKVVNNTSESEAVHINVLRKASFSVYTNNAKGNVFFDDNTIINIEDTSNYSDNILFTVSLDGNPYVTGSVAGVFTYDKTNKIDLSDGSALSTAINNATIVEIVAYAAPHGELIGSNTTLTASATLVNATAQESSFVYHESFDGASVSSTTFTGSANGTSGILANSGTAHIEATSGANYDKRNGVLKIDAATAASRGNYIQLENPLSDPVNAAFAKANGVTVSFWRHMDADCAAWLNAVNFTSYDSENTDNRYKYATLTASGRLTFVQRDNNNGNAENGGWMDYFPYSNDITNHSASSNTGFWTNIVLTVDPSKSTVAEAFTIYINGEPHDVRSTDLAQIARSKGGDYSSMSDSEIISAFLEFITDENTHFDFGYGGYDEGDKNLNMWLDDVRIYTEVKTQVDINNMYTDEYTDAKAAGVDYKSSTSHDPTNVTVYTLKEAVAGNAAGSQVGVEFIEYHNVPATKYDVEYYSFGTGLTVYHSYDNVNWTCVGDSQGRFGYQNQELFVSASGAAQPYYTTLSTPLAHAAQGASVNGNETREGAAGKLVWAPHVMYNLTQDKWMYYGSTSAWNSNYSTVFLLTSDYVDHGYKYQEMIVKTSAGSPTNAIDSCVYYGHNADGSINTSDLYCLYGSWGNIMVKTLNADGTRADGEDDFGTLLSVAKGGGEGGYMTYRADTNSSTGGYYYYYISPGANGWAKDAGAYNIRTYRSENPTSGFVAYNGASATNGEERHGNSFLSAYNNSEVPYEYKNIGHSSVYTAYNAYGEAIDINAAHTRVFSKGDLPIEDGQLATRQIWLIGNLAIHNPVAYTSDSWPTTFPLQYDETFSLHNKTASASSRNYFTAKDIDGVYAANIMTGDYATANTVDFKFFALNDSMGIFVNSETLESHLYFVEHTDDVTYIHLKDDDGSLYGEGVIANQGTDGSATIQVSYIIEKAGDSNICTHVFGVRTGDNTTVEDIKDDLDEVIDNIGEINGIGYYAGSPAVNSDDTKGYSNIAYSSSTTNWSVTKNLGYVDYNLGIPATTVLVYDGANDMAIPAVFKTVATESHDNRVAGIWATTSNFEFRDYWNGYTESSSTWPGAVDSSETYGYNTSNLTNRYALHTTARYFWNKLYYTGSLNDDTYSATVTSNPGFHFRDYWKNFLGITETKDEDFSVSANIYVINYKPIYDILTGTTKFPNTDIGFNEELYNDIKANKYTATSTMAFYRAMELILLANPTNDVYDYASDTSAAINSCVANIKHALEVFGAVNLERRADLTEFDKAFEKADILLNSLNGKAAQYDADSINTLKNALTATNVSTYINADAETRADYGVAVQSDADNLAAAINAAYDGLKAAPAQIDTSAFEAAVNTINNLDPEAYDNTSSISSAISAANAAISTDTVKYGDSTINVVSDSVSQQNVNDATTGILTALTASIKQYTVDASEANASSITANNGQYYTATNKATYGTKLTFRSNDPKTAWFLELQTATTKKKLSFAGSGSTFTTKVLGDIKVKSVSKTDDLNCRVTISRKYDNDADKLPVTYLDYVESGTNFELPDASALAFYSFFGYFYAGDEFTEANKIKASEIRIDEDTEIIAYYKVDSNASCAINATDINNASNNSSYAYNNKVELTGGSGTYAWIEAIDETHYRPFYIGEDVSFFASESTTLKAVNKTQFDSYKFTLPTINLRKSGVIESDNKTIFNAQVVAENIDNISECGILLGVPNGATPDASQLILENTGTQTDYKVVRAKSTKFVGANQISIAIKNVPDGVVYRGYVIYNNGDDTTPQTVYSDIMSIN